MVPEVCRQEANGFTNDFTKAACKTRQGSILAPATGHMTADVRLPWLLLLCLWQKTEQAHSTLQAALLKVHKWHTQV